MKIIIREAILDDAEPIAKVSIASWKTAYQDILPTDYLKALRIQSRTRKWNSIITCKDSIVLVAEEAGGRIIGFANGGTERTGKYEYTGELYALYLYESFHGSGIGTRLIAALTQRLVKKNISSMLVWVLKENKFKRFYEKLGGTLIDEKKIMIGDSELAEVAYGWTDINDLQK